MAAEEAPDAQLAAHPALLDPSMLRLVLDVCGPWVSWALEAAASDDRVANLGAVISTGSCQPLIGAAA